jgi:hypothetical protein
VATGLLRSGQNLSSQIASRCPPMFVVAERNVHQGTLRAQRLPEHPPALRKR